MAYDRTPDERSDDLDTEMRIRAVLDHTTETIASFRLANDEYDLSPDQVEVWIDRMFDDLRAALSRQELLHAVLMLLSDDADDRVRELTDQFRALPEHRRTVR